jgi:hypothetical protein
MKEKSYFFNIYDKKYFVFGVFLVFIKRNLEINSITGEETLLRRILIKK